MPQRRNPVLFAQVLNLPRLTGLFVCDLNASNPPQKEIEVLSQGFRSKEAVQFAAEPCIESIIPKPANTDVNFTVVNRLKFGHEVHTSFYVATSRETAPDVYRASETRRKARHSGHRLRVAPAAMLC